MPATASGSMKMDPGDAAAVEEAERNQLPEEEYKVYKQRWLCLIAVLNLIIILGFYSWFVPITNIFNIHMGISMDAYNLMTQVSMFTTALSVIIVAKAIEQYGIRRMCYITCLMITMANGLKALSCMQTEGQIENLLETHLVGYKIRFLLFLISEVFVGIVASVGFCLPAKFARVWFPSDENSRCIMTLGCGYNIGFGLTYFVPKLVTNPSQMNRMSLVFLGSAGLTTTLIFLLVTRSEPKTAPSLEARISERGEQEGAPFLLRLRVLMSSNSVALLLLSASLSDSIILVESLVMGDILNMSHYDNSFCGLLILTSNIGGILFLLFGGYIVDRAPNKVLLSKWACMIYAISLAIFNFSVCLPNMPALLMATNLLVTLAFSVKYPAQISVILSSSLGVIPESAVGSMVAILNQSMAPIFSGLLNPTRRLFAHFFDPQGYRAPLIALASIVLISNSIYVIFFKHPDLDALRQEVRRRHRLAIEYETNDSGDNDTRLSRTLDEA